MAPADRLGTPLGGSMYTLAPLGQRVHDAALVLDIVKPNWAAIVDMDTFDMSGTTTDIAAQLDLPTTLDYSDEDNYRSLVDFTLMLGPSSEDWSLINDAWCVEIFNRRDA